MVGSSHTWRNNPVALAHQVPAACHRLGIGKTTLYEEIKEGRIKVIKVGRRTLVPESELQRYINGKLQQASA
jgi:excisionase family DNA binding protein